MPRSITRGQRDVAISLMQDLWGEEQMYCQLCLGTAYLNLNYVLRTRGLGTLKTLATLREVLILPDKNINRIQVCVMRVFFCNAVIYVSKQSVWVCVCVCLHLRFKSSCSCSSWFSMLLVEIVESWFWIFCFNSLISSFKELIVCKQIPGVSQHMTRNMTKEAIQVYADTWFAVFSWVFRSSSFLFKPSMFLRRAWFASTCSDRLLVASISLSSNFFIRPKSSWFRSISFCNIKDWNKMTLHWTLQSYENTLSVLYL